MKSQRSAGLDAGYCGGVATPGPGKVVPDAAYRNTKCFRPLSLHSMPLFHIILYLSCLMLPCMWTERNKDLYLYL